VAVTEGASFPVSFGLQQGSGEAAVADTADTTAAEAAGETAETSADTAAADTAAEETTAATDATDSGDSGFQMPSLGIIVLGVAVFLVILAGIGVFLLRRG
jgi:cobalamin biosynthesis Mg chelatase CobN